MELNEDLSTKQALLEKQRKYLFPNHLLFYSEPLPLEKGEGSYVWDVEGNQYLDFFGGILTTSVGHNRREVTDRIHQQVDKLIHSSTLYPNDAHVSLAERLAAIAPGDIEVSYFTATGSEADETAVFLAQLYTGNNDIIALRHGYSGRSAMGMSLTAHSTWRAGSNEIAGIKHALNPYCYRCPLKMTYPSCGVACAEDVEDVIKTTTNGKIAAFIMEPIQGVGGFVTPPDDYFKIVHGIVKNFGGLFISDEVQTGFGRTGDHWFGIEHGGIVPDIITLAKGIANGMPLANTMTTKKIADCTIKANATISTFGGNPVSCSAGLGVLDVLQNEAGPETVAKKGEILRNGLDKLKNDFEILGDVRGKGLMQGLELVSDKVSREPDPKKTNQLLEATRENGLLIGKGGLHGNVIRIAPPLTTSEDEISEALEKLRKAFNSIK